MKPFNPNTHRPKPADWKPLAKMLFEEADQEFPDKSTEFVLGVAASRLNMHYETQRFDESHITEALAA